MIKHIFSDMDGTLLNDQGDVSQKNIQTIRNSKIPFTLVSARAPMEMATAIDELGLEDAQIAFNGGLIFQKGERIKILKSSPMSDKSFRKIMQLVARIFPEVSCSCYDANNWYTEKFDYGIEFETSITHQKPQLAGFGAIREPIYKIMLITSSEQQMTDLQHDLIELGLTDVSIKRSGIKYLEITSQDAQKSRGIEYIKDLYHLDKAEMAAFGDGHNDLPMLNEVGTPIVMDNALEEIKEYGKHITKSNLEDGVAYGIENFLNVE